MNPKLRTLKQTIYCAKREFLWVSNWNKALWGWLFSALQYVVFQLEDSKSEDESTASGWNHLYSCLVVSVGCQCWVSVRDSAGAVGRTTYMWPLPVAWLPYSMEASGCSLLHGGPGLQKGVSQPARHSGIVCYDQASKITLCHLNHSPSVKSKSQAYPNPRKGEFDSSSWESGSRF